MNVLHNPQFDIKKTTAHYTKKDGVPIHYVCTTDLDESDMPVDIYYREESHSAHTNYYFGLYSLEEKVMICKADLVEKLDFGMISDTGEEWVYSRSHHDVVNIESGFIDGGRKYIKRGGDFDVLQYTACKVKDGEFVCKEIPIIR